MMGHRVSALQWEIMIIRWKLFVDELNVTMRSISQQHSVKTIHRGGDNMKFTTFKKVYQPEFQLFVTNHDKSTPPIKWERIWKLLTFMLNNVQPKNIPKKSHVKLGTQKLSNVHNPMRNVRIESSPCVITMKTIKTKNITRVRKNTREKLPQLTI